LHDEQSEQQTKGDAGHYANHVSLPDRDKDFRFLQWWYCKPGRQRRQTQVISMGARSGTIEAWRASFEIARFQPRSGEVL
jgi:hypothetical protein